MMPIVKNFLLLIFLASEASMNENTLVMDEVMTEKVMELREEVVGRVFTYSMSSQIRTGIAQAGSSSDETLTDDL